MIIRWPGHIEPGTVVDDFVSAIDFAPTFLQAAGIEPPAYLQGHNFLGPDEETRSTSSPPATAATGRWTASAACDRKRYKYIRNYYPERPYTQFNAYKKLQYPMLTLMQVLNKEGKLTPEQAQFMAPTRPKEELYDLQNDPHELHNLAERPQAQRHPAGAQRKAGRVDQVDRRPGRAPEDPKVVAYWQDDMTKSYKDADGEEGPVAGHLRRGLPQVVGEEAAGLSLSVTANECSVEVKMNQGTIHKSKSSFALLLLSRPMPAVTVRRRVDHMTYAAGEGEDSRQASAGLLDRGRERPASALRAP